MNISIKKLIINTIGISPYLLIATCIIGVIMSWINDVRSKINIVKRYIYFNNASNGSLFTDTVEYIKKFLDMWNEEGHGTLHQIASLKQEIICRIHR